MVYGVRNKEAIKAVQSFLNEEGFTDGKGERLWVDGVYGANTANAMIKYQRANNLVPDGVTGDETWNSIYRKKRDREEREEFYKELKEKEGGYFYEKIKSIRKAQRAMGIETEGVLDGEEEEADNSGIFKNGIGTSGPLTLSTDPSHGALPASANPSYMTKGVAFRNYSLAGDESEFSKGNGKAEDYVWESSEGDSVFLNEEKTKQHEVALNTGDKNSNDAGVKPEPNKEEGGVIRPGYNQRGHWSQDPDADNYGKDSAKYELLMVFDKAYDIAIESGNRNAQIAIDVTVDNLRNYDTESITQAYLLIDNQGAVIFGHAGILLVNENGEGILFSYFRHNSEEKILGVQSDTRIGVFDAETTDKFLWGSTIKTPSSSGDFCTEQYDKGLKYKITPEQGKRILECGIGIASNNPEYNLFTNNCIQMAQSMLKAGGIRQLEMVIPKDAYKSNVIFSDGLIENGK